MKNNSKPCLLIVDDDRVSATILQKRCESRGFEVEYLSEGEKTLDVLDIARHEMILLDVMMPRVSGIEILKSIRAKYSSAQLPVIMITSKDDTNDIANAFENGANDYILKLVNMLVAMARIETHLNIRRLHEEHLLNEQLQAVKAMVITYNHEINNPLAIALGHLSLLKKKDNSESLERIQAALLRISEIVKKIDKFKHTQAEAVEYVETSRMYKV
jgi:DNA-binding response OmpR family regulator